FVVALLVPRTELFSTEGSFLGAFTLSVPLVLLFLARAVDGLTGGNISVANAYVSDVSTPETRSANFGRMGVSFNLGMVVGPALAGLLGATVYGELVPVALAVGISVTALVLIYFYLPESKPQTERTDREHHRACARTLGSETRDPHTATHCPKKKRQSLLSHPTLRYMVVLLFAMFLGFNLFYACFPVHAAQSLGWDALTIGGFFTTLSASMVVVEGPVLSWLSSRSTEPTRIVAGLSILACGFAWMFWAEGVAIYGVAVLFAAGNGIAWPTLTAYLAGLVDDSVQGAVQGLSGSAGSLASIFGLISGGLLYAEIGAVAFLIASGLIAVSAALALRLWSLKPVELDELEDAAAFNELAAAEG
ncbi:MAG: MFS transporter, partial [Myxococcota bacterium]